MSKVYKDGVITIPNVTGDLEITVTAVKSAPSYTNHIPISTDTDGSIYNSIGYMLNMRLPSNGVPIARNGCLVTGFIPFSVGDIIRVNEFCAITSYQSDAKAVFYKADHTKIAGESAYSLSHSGKYTIGQPLVWTPGTTITDSGSGSSVNISEAAYFRLSIGGYNDVAADIICTINEEIT